jgi:drug/metabolite transporter (DMT)-like permease
VSAPHANTVAPVGGRAGRQGVGVGDRQRWSGPSPVLLAGLGAASISASALIVKVAAVGAATTAFYRCAFALPALVGFAVIEQRRHGPRSRRARLGAVFAGLFFSVDLVLWTHAIVDVGAGVATVLGNVQVLFVVFIAWAALRERPSAQFLIALPVVMLGVVLVSGLTGRPGAGIHPLAGIVFGLGTSASYAAFLLILRHNSTGTPHIAGPLADATAGSVAGSLLLGLMFGGMSFDPSWQALGWLLLLATTSQTVGWLLITSSLPRLPAAVSSLMLLLQPAATLLLAAVLLAERPTVVQLLGAGLVCLGVLNVARTAGSTGKAGGAGNGGRADRSADRAAAHAAPSGASPEGAASRGLAHGGGTGRPCHPYRCA